MCQASAEVLLALSLYFIPYASFVFESVCLFKKKVTLILPRFSDICHWANSPLFTKLASNEVCAPKVKFCLYVLERSRCARYFAEPSHTNGTLKYCLLIFAYHFGLCS